MTSLCQAVVRNSYIVVTLVTAKDLKINQFYHDNYKIYKVE